MAQQLMSASWYRVAELRPRLRSHFRIHRHRYRGGRWYVLQDRMSRRTHRFDARAYFVIGLMNGQRSMQSIWDAALERYGDEAPTQEEVFPLLDPDRFLERWLAWYRPLFGPLGALVWLAVVGWGAFTAVQHWNELTHDLSSRVLAPENLLVMGLVFPVLKALHELGHACAVRAWGGEVHEMGIMFLVLMPVPYVDASAANAFAEKRRRVVVGAAGMIVEVFIAALALALWLELQPGIARAVLFNVMLIAGVSTVLFNANPLLRFDGYYILSDLIEIPNLRQRG